MIEIKFSNIDVNQIKPNPIETHYERRTQIQLEEVEPVSHVEIPKVVRVNRNRNLQWGKLLADYKPKLSK
jgi:hypothetical protein